MADFHEAVADSYPAIAPLTGYGRSATGPVDFRRPPFAAMARASEA
ncbi:MAG TPA: hypothetical protein VFB15_13810 [Candidatus Binataceae bacterium]|jgi:hypothetical protein|nr:hypothetical protein [Candidatus Binataceae bacterium]